MVTPAVTDADDEFFVTRGLSSIILRELLHSKVWNLLILYKNFDKYDGVDNF